jgi:catechol 2,3-dioxygenase
MKPEPQRDFEMDPAMRLGAPTLRVRNLDESLEFYESYLGMRKVGGSQIDGRRSVELGVGDPPTESLLALVHNPDAREPPPNSAGLFHLAILVPDRKSLASTLLAVGNAGVGFEGFADHLVSESLYLRDPEGNAIEIYRDKPREGWPFDRNGQLLMDTLPLDVGSVLHELSRDDAKFARPFPRGARIGHLHLKVSDVESAVAFYHEVLGLKLMEKIYGAAFLSAGGYHHHIAVNAWQSMGGPRHEEGDAGLERFTILVPRSTFNVLSSRISSTTTASDRLQLRVADPDGNMIAIEALS